MISPITVYTKPVEMQALQWTGDNADAVIKFLTVGQFSWAGYVKGQYVDIGTDKGLSVASIGDWIVKKGPTDFKVYKPDAYAATFTENAHV